VEAGTLVPPSGNSSPFGNWYVAARQVARAEHRGHAGDVGLERQRQHVEVQLDVLVELLRNTGRQVEFRHVAGRLGRDLDAPFDLTNLVGVLIDGPHVVRAELPLQAGQLASTSESRML
jgi:hypothetical protein